MATLKFRIHNNYEIYKPSWGQIKYESILRYFLLELYVITALLQILCTLLNTLFLTASLYLLILFSQTYQNLQAQGPLQDASLGFARL